MLAVNDKAPDFKLADQNGNVLSLSDYLGRWLLIYFYPKDFTPGCTKEACSFRDNFSLYKDKLEIVGISGDSVKSHEKFAEKYELPFPLLADPDKKTIKAYGTNGIIFAKRTSFLLNPEGLIKKIYPKVDPAVHAEQIINDIDKLIFR